MLIVGLGLRAMEVGMIFQDIWVERRKLALEQADRCRRAAEKASSVEARRGFEDLARECERLVKLLTPRRPDKET